MFPARCQDPCRNTWQISLTPPPSRKRGPVTWWLGCRRLLHFPSISVKSGSLAAQSAQNYHRARETWRVVLVANNKSVARFFICWIRALLQEMPKPSHRPFFTDNSWRGVNEILPGLFRASLVNKTSGKVGAPTTFQLEIYSLLLLLLQTAFAKGPFMYSTRSSMIHR